MPLTTPFATRSATRATVSARRVRACIAASIFLLYFSTLHAVSRGRAEVILGRGSFTESFPLFGFDLRQYELLFEEKLELFTALLAEQPVSWSMRRVSVAMAAAACAS